MANKQSHHGQAKASTGSHGHSERANIEESDVSFPLVAFFFILSGFLVFFSGGLAYLVWGYLSTQADKTAKSEYTLANKKRDELKEKYPERDANGFYYKRFENALPPYPRLEGLTVPAILADPNFKSDPDKATDLDHVIMSGNLAWPSEGAIQREKQEKILANTKIDGKEVLSVNDVIKKLANSFPVRDSKADKQLLDGYYRQIGAGSSGRSTDVAQPIEGAKP